MAVKKTSSGKTTTSKPATKKKATAAKKPAPKKPAAPKPSRYVSVRVALFHPFERVSIPLGPPGILLEDGDSWLECQIERGLVKKL